jgi:hypothetical protein
MKSSKTFLGTTKTCYYTVTESIDSSESRGVGISMHEKKKGKKLFSCLSKSASLEGRCTSAAETARSTTTVRAMRE